MGNKQLERSLRWRDGIVGQAAKTAAGVYTMIDISIFGLSGVVASFTPVQGRSRTPKERQPLGNFQTSEQARRRCERDAMSKQQHGGTEC
jgi:hypothetical protein